MMNLRQVLAVSLVFLALTSATPLCAATLDSTLFATYNTQPPYTSVSFSVCGSLPQSEGCFGGGYLAPFGLVGALIEGAPTQNLKKGTVSRNIYILDVAYGSSGSQVALYVYKRVDTITSSSDSIATTLTKTVVLPLTGGSGTVAYMAANGKFLFIGTSQSGYVAQVTKSSLAATLILTPPVPLDSITADQYGYVSVQWGSNQSAQFQVIDPNGDLKEDGGGTAFMVNTLQATLPSTVVPQ
ncbi:MAG: hypothetical protein WAM43_05490 [Terriglobales bacterium]